MADHYLPSKVQSYLVRLDLEYARERDDLRSSIIRNARVAVIIETEYDNWNGGTHGHDLVFFLPPEVMRRVPLREQNGLGESFTKDLNACAAGVSNEYIRAVTMELNDQNDPRFQSAVQFSPKPPINPETLAIWRPGHIRLFVSHRDGYKRKAQRLARELEGYGISSFVAHDTIEPMEVWQHEIEKGLATMEIMLALITEDFQDSVWTNQEVGYALGKAIPIIPLRLGSRDPSGFIAERQALKGDPESPEETAEDIYKIIAEKLGQKARLQEALVSALAATPDWGETTIRFKRVEKLVEKLTAKQEARLVAAFNSNDQLHRATHLKNNDRFVKFLECTTGKVYEVRNDRVKEKVLEMDEEIPF